MQRAMPVLQKGNACKSASVAVSNVSSCGVVYHYYMDRTFGIHTCLYDVLVLYEGLNGGTSITLNTYFFWLYNIKQLIFSHLNTNIKKFVVTLFFSHKQTNYALKGEISMLGLCLLYQRGFLAIF